MLAVNPALLLGPGDDRGSSTGDVVRFLEKKVPFIPAGGLSFVDARDAAAAMILAMERGRAGERYLVSAANLRGSLRPPLPLSQSLCMGVPAMKPRRATYADLEAVPTNKVAELIEGTLYVMPRPASPHANAASGLTGELRGPFHRGRGGPGGWVILIEPELHFPDPTAPGEEDALAPDLAGWRRERMPIMPRVAAFTLAPDWICEVVSPSTEEHDRAVKMPVYAREGVRHAWLIDPVKRTLEVYTLGEGRRWSEPAISREVEVVRAVPFDAIELDLSALWT